jgi:uncharacterized protein
MVVFWVRSTRLAKAGPAPILSMGLRFLLLAAALAVIVMVVRTMLRARRGKGAPQEPAQVEDMVRCRVCGVHVPRSEAVETEEGLFCSRRHLEDFHRED